MPEPAITAPFDDPLSKMQENDRALFIDMVAAVYSVVEYLGRGHTFSEDDRAELLGMVNDMEDIVANACEAAGVEP